MEKIDLHMHSHYSDDADYPVAELIARCLREGVTTLAVTDHNSAFSFAESIKWRSDSLNIISGIEIDCTFQGRNFHLLGYGLHRRMTSLWFMKTLITFSVSSYR